MRAFARIVGFILLLLAYTKADLNCGKLTIDQMYNENAETDLDEFPWFGRIYYNNSNKDTKTHRCNAVLISDRHLLTPAHCALVDANNAMDSVLLGDSYSSNANTEADCNNHKICAPPPVFYPIEKIFIHPEQQKRSRNNDVAIIQLSKSVTLGKYVQPICLPDATLEKEQIPEYLVYSGYVNKRGHEDLAKDKLKTVAHILDHQTCMVQLAKLRVDEGDELICGTYASNFTYLSGASIMGIRWVQNIPHNYYLIGMVNAGTVGNLQNPLDIFIPTSTYLNWIKSVITE